VVSAVRGRREDISEQLKLAAEFRSYQEIDLRARVAGHVKDIRVDVGDTVRKGELIATLEAPESASELVQAGAARKRSERELQRNRSDVNRARAELDAARLTYSRLAGVFQSNPNLIARQEVDDALARVRVAEAQLDAEQAGLATAEEDVNVQKAAEATARTLAGFTVISAPIAGVVTRRYVDRGDLVHEGSGSQGQPIVQLSQVDPLRLILPMPQSAVSRMGKGRTVRVTVPAIQKTFDGEVARVSGKIDARTGTMELEVDVPNPHMTLHPGMYAFVEIVLANLPSAMTVPVQAVKRRGGRATVMVINAHDRLEEREVLTGNETPASVQILTNLSDSELVVVGSRSGLKPGQRVTPKETPLDATAVDY
jgi:RND family efflux transporter MFP subunit